MLIAALAAAGLVLALSGCTCGLGEEVTFLLRNLRLTGELADGVLATEEGTVTVAPRDEDPASGVVTFVDGSDAAQAITGTLELDGNVGALCPGASVELEGEGDRLEPVFLAGPGCS